MIEYFYPLDLGHTYGPKLEQLAAEASFDDVEAFAALLLIHTLDRAEHERADGVASRSCPNDEKLPDSHPGKDLDDDIPF